MLDLDLIRHELAKPAIAALHVRLRRAIEDQIQAGTAPPGTRLPPERVLQEQLAVSRSTVRQAIRALADAGLLKCVVGSGNYVQVPRTTAPRPLIGVIVPNTYFYIYYAQLASTLNGRLRDAGYRVDMSLHNAQTETLSGIVDSLLDHEVVALAFYPTDDERVVAVLDRLRAAGVTMVMIARYWQYPGVDYVGADNDGIGYEATRHLLGLGHSGVVHVTAAYGSTARGRAGGYVRAMQEAGLPPRIYLFESSAHPGALGDLAPYLQSTGSTGDLWTSVRRRETTAAFCFNDDIASWVQKELRRADLHIPHDLSLVGVDNMPYTEFFDVPLTTFALPGEEIGRQAADLLIQRLQSDKSSARSILVPARFVHRLSTAPTAP